MTATMDVLGGSACDTLQSSKLAKVGIDDTRDEGGDNVDNDVNTSQPQYWVANVCPTGNDGDYEVSASILAL